MIDGSFCKIMKHLLFIVKNNFANRNDNNWCNILQVIEESIRELPLLILSQTINTSHGLSIKEIEQFIHDILIDVNDDSSYGHAVEIWLLLYTRMGGLDPVLQWLSLVITRLNMSNQSMIRTEVLSHVLESLFIGGGQLTVEIRDHLKDCLHIDIIDHDTMPFPQAINSILLGILRAFQIHLRNRTNMNETILTKCDSKNQFFKDIYIWEHGKELQSTKAPYPDSLLTRLNSANENHSVNQVICCQKEVIVLNTLGQVRSKGLANKSDNICVLLDQCWSPIHFPDINCKIDHISVGHPGEKDNQHVLALSHHGQVYSWGGGSYGQLGHGDLLDRRVPTLIEGLRGYNIKKISTGSTHSAAVSETGLAFVWGNSENFNGKSGQICTTPKRLHQGIMSNVICGPRATFLLSINKRNIYYLGSQCSDNRLYNDEFVLKHYPNLIEGIPFTNCDKSEKIEKVVANSSGVIVLLNNGSLYSIGHGLVIGCPNCRIHNTFESVKSMTSKIINDVAISETHVVVLTQNMVLSWSLVGAALELVEEQFNYSFTSISAASLVEQNKHINIAWSKHSDQSSRSPVTIIRNQNPYLSITSSSTSIDYFKIILKTSFNLLATSQLYEKYILNTLKLFIQCMKTNQLLNISMGCETSKKSVDDLMDLLLCIGDFEGINEKIKKTVCKIIDEACSLFYLNAYHKVERIFHIVTINSNIKSLSSCHRFWLKNLILSFNDTSNKIEFSKLLELSLNQLDDLLITICKMTSTYIINVFQGRMYTGRPDFPPDESINDLLMLLHRFSTIGYRIFLSQLDHTGDNHYNPINNLCSLLPLTNSIIGCFKSYLLREIRSQKVSNWLKFEGSPTSFLLSKSPISWILFDVFNYLVDQEKLDILPLIPHLERLIISLDSINMLLPKTSLNDTQEIQWSLYGFSGCPNMLNTLPEPGSSWLWLLDLERLSGLVLGHIFKKELAPSVSNENDNKTKPHEQLDSALFKHIVDKSANKPNELNSVDFVRFSECDKFLLNYKSTLRIIINDSKNNVWLVQPMLMSFGFNIYGSIIYLSNSKCPSMNLESLQRSFSIYKIFRNTLQVISKYLVTLLGLESLAQCLEMTKGQKDIFQNILTIINLKCVFLMNLFKDSLSITKSEQVEECCSSFYIELDLAIKNNIKSSKISGLSRWKSQISNKMFQHHDIHEEMKLNKFLYEIEPNLIEFLTDPLGNDDELLNDHVEATKSFLLNLSMKIYFKRTSIDRTTWVLTSLARVLDPSNLTISSVLIQIVNSMLTSHPYSVDQLHATHYPILENIFSILLSKLTQCIIFDNKSIISQRMGVSIINFLSSYQFYSVNLINLLIDGDFVNCIACLTNNKPFISMDKWLVIEGNGDNNLPNVCNIIAWCLLENFIFNISYVKNLDQLTMERFEVQLRRLMNQMRHDLNGNSVKAFDVYSFTKSIWYLYSNCELFKKCCSLGDWVNVLMDIACSLKHLEEGSILHSRYALNLVAMELIFSMILFEESQGKSVEDIITKLFQRFSGLYSLLLSRGSQFPTMELTNSLDCRLNLGRHLTDDLDFLEDWNTLKWISGNPNFDKTNSLKCEFITCDKVSVTNNYSSNNFLALNREDLCHGIWRVVFDVECKESSVDFSYGFIANQHGAWPKDHLSLMKLLKHNAPLSISCRSSVSCRLSCIIDLDKWFVYFSNGNNAIQPFINVDGVYRFFISSFKTHSSSFQIQMVSIKQLLGSELHVGSGFFNNSLLAPDHYRVFDALYCGFNKIFNIQHQWIRDTLINSIITQCEFLKDIDLYLDKSVFDRSMNDLAMFALFLLNNRLVDHGFCQGQLISFSSVTERNGFGRLTNEKGIIVKFEIKRTNQFEGLNFLEKTVNHEDVQCVVFSLKSRKNVSISIDKILKEPTSSESVYLKSLKTLCPSSTMAFVSALFKCVSFNYFDLEITNYEGLEWITNSSEYSMVEFHFMKFLCVRLLMKILFKKSMIHRILINENEKPWQSLKFVYDTILKMGSKSSPLRKQCRFHGLQIIGYKLLDCFYQIQMENELDLVKKYAHMSMDNYPMFDSRICLSESELLLLFRVLKKQPFGRSFIENITMGSRDHTSSSGSRAVSFGDRRRKLNDHALKNRNQLFQNLVPANEFDTNIAQQTVLQEAASLVFDEVLVEPNQRLMDDFVVRTKSKKRTCVCPICEIVVKMQTKSLYSHISLKHPHNCMKTFQHYASICIKSEGELCPLNDSTIHCASITTFGYCVCTEFVNIKCKNNSSHSPCEDFDYFVQRGFSSNCLIGASGTLISEHYCHTNIADVNLPENPKTIINLAKILGEHIHRDVNYGKIILDPFPEKTAFGDDSLIDEIPFIAVLSCGAISKSLKRLEYASLILASRELIVKLVKLVCEKQSRQEAISMMKYLSLIDGDLVMNLIRLVECNRIIINDNIDHIYDEVRLVKFNKSDFISVLLVGLESSMQNDEQVCHNIISIFIAHLEKFLTSNKYYFQLNKDYDATIFARPNPLLIQVLFNVVYNVLSSSNDQDHPYSYWQTEVEQIMEFLSFGILFHQTDESTIDSAVSDNCMSEMRIWSLHCLSKMFRLIETRSKCNNSNLVNMVDLCEDLSASDSPTIHLANCNATVKKLISVLDRRHILTADCEGTMRLWDIDSIGDTEQHLRQTFIFSLGDQFFKEASIDGNCPEVMEKCLQMAEPLKFDLSNYLIQVGVQKIAFSPTGHYLAESLGIYLNIWSTKNTSSKPPCIMTFASLITGLVFPRQMGGQDFDCPADILLVALADGDLNLLTISDLGIRVTQQHIAKSLTNISSHVTTVAWDCDDLKIAVGYHDGTIAFTDPKSDTFVFETVHSNRIFILAYCPFATQYGKTLLASSSVDEAKIAIWKAERLMCVITLSTFVTCMEWLSKSSISDNNHYVIIVGTATGLIEFWQIGDGGDCIENLLTLYGHVSPILELKICQDTNLLASGCNNGWINVWNIDDRSLISTCRGDGLVIGLGWSVKSNLVAAFSRSQYIKIWRFFNSNTLQKNGTRQFAYIRKIFIQSTGVKSIKHLKHLKRLFVSLHNVLDQQYTEEKNYINCGFTIVYSQYLRQLVQFSSSLDLITKCKACSFIESIEDLNKCQPIHRWEINTDKYRDRTHLSHYLNLDEKDFSRQQFDWLMNIDEAVKLTRCLFFETELFLNTIPRWWWIWCLGSDYLDYLRAKWKNEFWSMDQQIELYQWYQNNPKYWIEEYSDSTFIYGCGIKGELGTAAIVNCSEPILIEVEGIQQVMCGSGVTLVVTCEGKLMACGEGLEIIFNPFMREDPYKMINVPILNDYKIKFVTASRGPESHIIAITSFGEVFSWGIGSYGKLGHGHATTLKKPKLIETLRGKGTIMAACGHMHSAVVTASGELYTFGLGASGQLGIEILSVCDTPRLVDFDNAKFRAGFVACGMNHTLVLSTDGLTLYSFGEGAYGKLGVGDYKDHFSPVLVDLKKKSLLKVVCGKDFSTALTNDGEVLNWGHGDFIGTAETDDNSVNHKPYPLVNTNLQEFGVFVDIEAGNDTAFAITASGLLFGWGSNNNNLLRLGHETLARIPTLISFDNNIHVKQVSCGRYHIAVSSHPLNTYRNCIPSGPPLKSHGKDTFSVPFPALQNSGLNMYDITARLVFLLYWNEMVRLTWQFWIPQTNQHFDLSDLQSNMFSTPLDSWPIMSSEKYLSSHSNWSWEPFNQLHKDEIRQLINGEFLSTVVYRYLNASMVNNRSYNTLVRIDRINMKESVFIQTCRQVLSMDPADLRLPWRAWKVKLINEGADDAGGAYDETISEICNELESDNIVPRVLVPVPSDPTSFILNPDPEVPVSHFRFLGILIASAVRTKKPINLHLDPFFWKRITKSRVTIDDLARLDPAYFNSLISMNDVNNIRDCQIQEIYAVDGFICHSINTAEMEVVYQGFKRPVNESNISDFVNRCLYYRLHEFDRAIEHVRVAFCSIAPMVILDMMNWKHLEKMVCGSKSINVDILKSIARYVDVDETDIIIVWFWQIIESFTESEKNLFLRFVTGKSRLPAPDSHIPFRLFIYISKQPINSLPQSQTCFNQIRLPRYHSRADMETRLRIAINQCRSIDTDDYMLTRNREQ